MTEAKRSSRPPRKRIAFADESASNTKLDPGTYILAAAVLSDPASAELARIEISALKKPAQRKVHWRDESDHRRTLVIETIASTTVEHLLVVRHGQPKDPIERRRRQCLTRLLYELDNLEVAAITFESRGRADDRKDNVMVQTLRANRTVSSLLRVDHRPGPSDPLLWVPDALCGAMVQHRVGNPAYLKTIQARTTFTVIETGRDPFASPPQTA